MGKKAVVIGGSSGIGLAVSRELIALGYFVEICSRSKPDAGILQDDRYRHCYCDLTDFNEDLFRQLAEDKETEILMITAGVGRVADFRAHHLAEIDRMLTVDLLSAVKAIRIFYDRIISSDPFYSGVVSSISGHLCSPAASVYSAAKAGVSRFVESVNIELEVSGTSNRILDVSPAFFPGSRFYGGENDLSLTMPLARVILTELFERETLFIPQYEETFKDVLERYHEDPHGYGLYSYEYKKGSGRIDNSKKVRIGYLSGTFDLFHVGHLNILKHAKEHCDYLIVGVHESGQWKGKETFIPFDERKSIVAACRYVDRVVDSCLEDSEAWSKYKYDMLFVGTDYKGSERFLRYEEFFSDKGVKIIYLPYTQSTSSTMIRKTILLKTKDIDIETEK